MLSKLRLRHIVQTALSEDRAILASIGCTTLISLLEDSVKEIMQRTHSLARKFPSKPASSHLYRT